MPEPKYISINGVMKRNPAYVAPGATSAPQIPVARLVDTSNLPLAVVSSPDDVITASMIQEASYGTFVPMAAATEETLGRLQGDEILRRYHSSVSLDGGQILDKIGELFTRYETPLGMLSKLMMLMNYKLDFLIDDSGSMANLTNVAALEATDYVKAVIRNRLGREPRPNDKMSRFEEAEDRLHIMIGILAYIPIEHIQIRSLNAPMPVILVRDGKTPEEFEHYAHQVIRDQFNRMGSNVRRRCGTPVRDPLSTGFSYEGNWCHYLFNDGEPNEGGAAIATLIKDRTHPEKHALALLSCTNNNEETAWMKQVDGSAEFVAELDDYQDEKEEVIKKQGDAFPYPRGIWLLCNLVAPINPFDLDALDENLPLTKFTLDTILGRQHNPDEYQYYFERKPGAELYVNEYNRFLSEKVFARQIIPKDQQKSREQNADYIDGERPDVPLVNISSLLAPITAAAKQVFMLEYGIAANTSAATLASAASIAPNAVLFMGAAAADYPPPPPYEASKYDVTVFPK